MFLHLGARIELGFDAQGGQPLVRYMLHCARRRKTHPDMHSQLYAFPSERFDARRVPDLLGHFRMSAPLEMGGARYPPTSLYVDFWFGHAALYCSS